MLLFPGLASGVLGGYPVPFLRCIVKMNKLLKIKRELLNKIKNLNSTVERKVYPYSISNLVESNLAPYKSKSGPNSTFCFSPGFYPSRS